MKNLLTLPHYSCFPRACGEKLWLPNVQSCLFCDPWTVAHQAPLSMEFPRQEYWSELPFPSSGDLPNPGIKSMAPVLPGGFFITEPPGKLVVT